LLDQSSKQIENIVFGHKAETPGLGDKITERAFEERFIGRQLNNTHTFLVQKKMKENPAQNTYPIEGVSGASITVEGVTDMLNQAASSYSELLHNK
jgi:Na+-transporting NADH:ubiquinone oxidoreductase subunit C